jgi:hypothetical protein
MRRGVASRIGIHCTRPRSRTSTAAGDCHSTRPLGQATVTRRAIGVISRPCRVRVLPRRLSRRTRGDSRVDTIADAIACRPSFRSAPSTRVVLPCTPRYSPSAATPRLSQRPARRSWDVARLRAPAFRYVPPVVSVPQTCVPRLATDLIAGLGPSRDLADGHRHVQVMLPSGGCTSKIGTVTRGST